MATIEPAAQPYYDRIATWDIAAVISDLRVLVDEWDYATDPHGYCHQRPLLLRALDELDRLRG